jgi:hypothetical protein
MDTNYKKVEINHYPSTYLIHNSLEQRGAKKFSHSGEVSAKTTMV